MRIREQNIDGDAQLTREQILEAARSIRAALETCSSPSERQQLRVRYDELSALLKSTSSQPTATKPSAHPNIAPPPIPAANSGLRKCPFCAEHIKVEAIKCRFCGERLDGSLRASTSVKKPNVINTLEVAGKRMQSVGNSLMSCGCLIFVALGAFAFLGVTTTGNHKPTEYRNDSGVSPARSNQFVPRTAPKRPAQPNNSGSQSSAVGSTSVEREIREIATREYPNDPRMQEYIYNNQMAAYRYMQSVQDAEVKGIAGREYPGDFAMQQYVYNNQASAKRYMSTISDSEVGRIAMREYPDDYSMQKYVYDKQLSAKQYMNAQASSGAKSHAQREYPGDYSMQKYIYDRNLR